MKLLYISSICQINSFGEVSRKYIKMFENYSNWDVYLYNINSTISNKELNIELSGNIKGIEYLPDYILLVIIEERGVNHNLFTKNNSFSAYAAFISTFKKHFYTYLYPRLTNKDNLYPNFSGKEQKRSRIGLRYGEVNYSGMGFQNDWAILQVGRGREVWGAGDDIQLVFNNSTQSYDYFKLGLLFKNIRLKLH